MISPKVMSELHQAKLVPTQFTVPKPGEHAWSPAEQRRFWEAIQRFPQGPWTAIAAYVGSKSTRQAMTHAQKLRQKLNRWKRRVRSDSVSSTCSNNSNSSTSASVTTPVDTYASSNGSTSPPMSPTEYGEMAKLSIMDHIDEEMTDEDEKKSGDCEPMDIKSEVIDREQFDGHEHAHGANVHDDRYLEHLLSDIEPVLEHVAHFTNGGHGQGGEVVTRPVDTVDYGSEQAAYFNHPLDASASEHKTMELSTWNQHHHDPAYYQYSSASSPMTMEYTSTDASSAQHNNYHHL
ncbi:hypothetical protein PHYBOEH_002999 [Phytophthora boehmeriae]|uniref:Myb-like domain-containing protein n=1 Tax=Phytophthora boehmeriae TaxID=109152 RepID=A0A8T1X5U2_9STRA|nr:hypothetical protein PHYBOEH_002999 [Phytophthora boehmeriae]